jgi:hypothetical protein
VDPEVNPVLRPTPAVPRVDPELRASELVALPQWLDYHRATLLLKCDGLDPAQLATRAVPPSSLSLLGLLRHLTEVERSWSAGALAGRDVTPVYYSDDDPDGDFGALDSHPVDEVYAAYHAAVAESRAICAAFTSADEVGRGPRGPDRSVRWVLLHLIEEYARHNGHADLLREALDGVRGE